jgi:hypothetical protein
MTAPKRVTKNLSVMRTDDLDRNLRVIRETGKGQSEATRWALYVAANILQHAWHNGHAERGTIPEMRVIFPKEPAGQ